MRKQPFDNVAAIERGHGNEIEHGKEQVDQHEIERVRGDDCSPISLLATGYHDGHSQQRRARQCQQQVHSRTGERDENHVSAGVAKATVIDRNRLGPAEHRSVADGQKHWQDHRPERIDVADRIEGQAAFALGGRIAELPGDEAVSDLVEDDRNDERHEPDRDLVNDIGVHWKGVRAGIPAVKLAALLARRNPLR